MMTNKTKLAILMLIITVFAVTALAACTSVGVAGISIKQGSDYKTEYVVGEELDLTGVELAVTRTDGSVYYVFATAVMQDIKVLNFNTSNVVDELAVVIEYKGASTYMFISVISHEDAVKKYTVTFETGSGSKVDSVIAQELDTITAPEEPTRAGYAFDGWYKENTYNNIWNFNVDKVVANTTLYAKWAKLYTITFKDTITGTPDVIKYVKAGDSLSDIPPTPTVDGKIITWDRESITEVYSDIEVKTVSKDATYTVLFYYYGFESGEAVVLGQPITNVPHGITTEEFDEMFAVQLAQIYNDLPRNDTVNHKHFSNWDKGYNNVVSNLEICAQYEYNKYDVTFNLNYFEETDGFDPVFAVNEDIVYNNPTSTLTEEPVRPGYAFDGWFKQPACIDAWNFNNDRVQEDTVLYAKWTELYSVYFVIDLAETIDSELGEEGTPMETIIIKEAGNDVTYKLFGSIEVRKGSSVNKLELPIKTGYTSSWDIDDNALKNITGNRVVKAKFQINSYAVRFFNHDRTAIIPVEGEEVQMVEYLSAAVAPEAPERVGYSFIGWDKNYNSIVEAIDVVAVYEPNAYDVILVLNNDSATPTYVVSVKYGQSVEFPEGIDYAGYYLEGWYTEATFINKWDSDDILEIAGHRKLTLYARWLKIHTIVFETYKGNTTLEVIDGNYINESDVPEITYEDEYAEGYTGFWYKVINENTNDKVLFDITNPVEGNNTYRLVYELNIYDVHFFIETTSLYPCKSFRVWHGDYIDVDNNEVVEAPTKEGYNFVGWTITASDAIVENTNVYAIFEIKTFILTWLNEEGTQIATSMVEYSKPAVFPISATAPTKKGHLLNGWIVKETDDANSTVQLVTSAMVLEPEFVLEPYTIDFKNRETNSVYEQFDGNGYVASQTKVFNTFVDVNATVSVPQKTGYSFVGWDAPYYSSVYADNYFVDSAIETHAWKAINSNISSGTHNMRNASLIVYEDKLYYSELSVEEIANRLSYWGKETFDASGIYQIEMVSNAWLKKGSGMEGDTILTYSREIAFGGHMFVAITENTTFFARFEVASFKFSFVTNDPAQELESLTITYGTLSRRPVLNDRKGYVFLGWYADEDFNEEYVFDTLVEKDTTIYAKWEEIREYTDADGIEYTKNEEGTAYVLTSAQNYTGTSLTVANYFNGLIVNAIGAEAFKDNSTIVSIDLPNTILAIGPKAFMNATALASIVIPEKVAEIPDNAFYGCSALTTVSFSERGALTKIGTSAFANANALKYSIVNDEQVAFALPQTITDIESSAFYGCSAFTELEIPASVINIG
ncbi:MAG: InlB B-repeat-containing protein, partial [Clostridia bacterium]|nr:InlB B-repeat-containing protein [Clostridia bacterium]